MLKKSTATIAALFASSTILVNTSFAASNDNLHKEIQVIHNAEQQKDISKIEQELEKKIENDKKLEEKNQKDLQKKLESIDKQLIKIEEKITKYEVKFSEMDDKNDDEVDKEDQPAVSHPIENTGEKDSEEVDEENANSSEVEKTDEVPTTLPGETDEEAKEETEEEAKEDAEEESEEKEEAIEDLEKEIDDAVEEYNDYLGKFKALDNRLNAVVNQLDVLGKKGVDNALLTERYDRVAALKEKLNAAIAKITQVQDKVIEKIKNDHDIEMKEEKEEKIPKKEWTIYFNKQLDEKTLSELSIVVYDGQHNLIETTMTYNAEKKSINLTPMQAYKVGTRYTLYIGKEITSSNGEGLKKSVKMNFIIR